MNLNSIKLALGVSVAGLASCGTQTDSSSVADQARALSKRCVTAEQRVDSAFVVAQARSALSFTRDELMPASVQPVNDQGVEVGVIISLIVVGPNPPVGGGGLVWVDADSGCPILLRRYE